jgi:cell division inhibitor SepF
LDILLGGNTQMSIWDSVKKFAQPYSDDEYDEYDDYEDEYEDDVDEEPARRPSRKPTRPTRTRRAPMQREPEPEIEEEDYEEDFTAAFNSVPKTPAPVVAAAPAAPAERSFPGKVVSMGRHAQEIVRFHPTSFQDSRKAATDLVASKAVIVNLEELDKDASRRMVDFLSGVVFAMDGDVQKIAQNAYVFCPPNMFITGGPEALQSVVEEIL